MGNVCQMYPRGHEKWLDDDATLWRYVPLKTLFFYLAGNIFIPSLAKLQQGDPFEGKFPFETRDFQEALQKRYGKQYGAVQKWIRKELWTSDQKGFINSNKGCQILAKGYDRDHYFEFLRRTRYAWCWFHSGLESDAMWKIYGKEGVAVATTVGCLSTTLKATRHDFLFGKMCHYHRHGRFSTWEKQQFVLRPHFLKRIEYAHENEVRFVTSAPEQDCGGLLLSSGQPETWIKQIRLWPGLISQEEDSIKAVIKERLPGVPCSKSNLLQTDGPAMCRMKEKLRALAAKNAEEQWKNEKDGVPPPLKNP